MSEHSNYDCILFVSFGGPEGPDDVMPFLENVLRGKPVPRERMLEVAEHYMHFDGISPINEQNRELISALRQELDKSGIDLPIYWGNRNWHPMLPDTLKEMRDDGRQSALAFFTSIFSCYSGCRQYRENIQVAQEEVGEGAPQVQKVRMGYNHPLFIEAQAAVTRDALEQFQEREQVKILFTAHSIPLSMSENSRYTLQLQEAASLTAGAIGHSNWELVYQSRSGPPQQPWLEPDICDRLNELIDEGHKHFVIVPIGFISDHMEVLFDLDTEAREVCEERNAQMVRAATVSTHPSFVAMIRELIAERLENREERPAIGQYPASHDVCPQNCCLYPRPTRPMPSGAPQSS